MQAGTIFRSLVRFVFSFNFELDCFLNKQEKVIRESDFPNDFFLFIIS